MTALVKYEAARQALAEAHRVDEVKDILDKVSALQLYAKQANDTDMEIWVAEIRMRARRRIGELSKDLDKNERARTDLRSSGGTQTKTDTLKRAGISKAVAHRCEKVAEVPETEFEAVIAEAKDKHRPVTYADIERQLDKERKKRETKERREKLIASNRPRSGALFQLHTADIRELELERESIDYIITDPPYPVEFLDCYRWLAERAVTWLRPGGSLVAMAGQSYLPDVLQRLCVEGLQYRWTISYLTPGGQAVQIFPRQINTFWKPVIWLTKGKREGSWVGDVVSGKVNDNDKRFHYWGQSESGMGELIRKLTEPGQTILDPFCGGGTTGVVAVATGRYFIGADNDPTAIETTAARLQEVADAAMVA